MQPPKFRIKIAVFNFVGYCTAVGLATVIDPLLKSHVHYPDRNYPHAWIWLLISPLVPLLTYCLLSLRPHHAPKAMMLAGSSLPLVLAGVFACFGFPPERPHVGILISTVSFSGISFLTVWLRLRADGCVFLNNAGAPYASRLERLKATTTMWQMIAVYGAGGYLVFTMSWAYTLYVAVNITVKDDLDRFRLAQGEVIQILIITTCVVLGPLLEAFDNAFEYATKLSEVVENPEHISSPRT